MYTVNSNSLGYRDENFSKKNAKNHRIAFIGDSFTFGWGVERESRFSERTVARLERISKADNYSSLNFGIPGYGLKDYHKTLRTANKYNPETTVISIHSTDFISSEDAYNYLIKAQKQVPGQKRLGSERVQKNNRELRREALKDLNITNSDFKEYIPRIAERASKNDTSVIFYEYLPLSTERSSYIRKLAEEHGAQYVEAPEELSQKRQNYLISKTDSHYNREGHKLAAKNLSDQIMGQSGS